ncbi:formylglycine-generating enzyme family protein [Paenibacillus sp. MCAF20]
MRKMIIFLFIATTLVVGACSQQEPERKPEPMPENFVFVQGGAFVNKKSNYYGQNVTLSSFYIGKYEVTQKEWMDVMGSNPSAFKGDDLPVETVSWYDAVEYCNKRSIKEGLTPYYHIDKNNKDPKNKSETDHLRWTVTINGYGDSDSNSNSTRVVKGGGWMGDVGELSYLSNFEANGIGPDQGFRVSRGE